MANRLWTGRTVTPGTVAALGVALTITMIVSGCRHNDATPATETPTKAQKVRPPDRQVFAPFKSLIDISQAGLPFLIRDDTNLYEYPCFTPIENVIAAKVTAELDQPLARNKRAISKVLREWVRDTVGPTAVRDAAIDGWTIVPEEVATLEIDDRAIRFAEEEECISSSTGWLEDDIRVAAGVFGAKTFTFTAKAPLSRNKAQELLEEFRTAGFTAETEDLVDYELVTDADGEVRLGSAGEKLYRHPELGVVSENDITPPARQRMKTWIVESPEPVFFGYRELNKVAWRREADVEECNVNLVWMDPAFRGPDCDEFDAVGFKAAKRGDVVEIQMQIDGEEEPLEPFEMEFDTVKRLQVNDRIILWVSPVSIEEGALIRLNSLVLAP